MPSRWPQIFVAPPTEDGVPRRLVRIAHTDQVETTHFLTTLIAEALDAPLPHQPCADSPLDFYLLLTPDVARVLRELAAVARRLEPTPKEAR